MIPEDSHRNSTDATGAPHNLTDLGNANRFIDQHDEDVRYVYQWNKWLVCSGKRWEVNASGKVERWMQETVRTIYAEAAAAEDSQRPKDLANHAKRSELWLRMSGAPQLARSWVAVLPGELDIDPWLLNMRERHRGEPMMHPAQSHRNQL
jgi:hypothetical protein